MVRKPYILTTEDKELLNALILDLATELDLHYDDEDMHALFQSFSIIKEAIALLERAACQPHLDILAVVARFNKTNQ